MHFAGSGPRKFNLERFGAQTGAIKTAVRAAALDDLQGAPDLPGGLLAFRAARFDVMAGICPQVRMTVQVHDAQRVDLGRRHDGLGRVAQGLWRDIPQVMAYAHAPPGAHEVVAAHVYDALPAPFAHLLRNRSAALDGYARAQLVHDLVQALAACQ